MAEGTACAAETIFDTKTNENWFDRIVRYAIAA